MAGHSISRKDATAPCRAGSPAATGRPERTGTRRRSRGRLKNTCATNMPERPWRPGHVPADMRQRRGQIAGSPEQRQYAKRGDDCRQCQRQCEQAQDNRPTGKGRVARQGARDKDRRDHGKRRRQDRLPEREADNPAEIGVERVDGAGKIAEAFDEQAGKGSADQQRYRGKSENTGEHAPIGVTPAGALM